jgi:predicted DCC family thiol-disulfide oxidoreductase YuxK
MPKTPIGPEADPTGSQADLTVFYDGACPLCRAEIGAYRTCSGADRVAFIDVANAPAGAIVPGLEKDDAMKRFHVRTGDGKLVSGAAGFAALWLQLPKWRWLGRLILRPAVTPVAELAYRGFLHVRPALQWIARRASART